MRQILSLDGHELFTQLVSQTNLVKIGPRNGLFSSFVDVEEGVVRVWRKWLRDVAAEGNRQKSDAVQNEPVEVVGKGKEPVLEVTENDEKKGEVDRVLWVTTKKHTGIRFNVQERKLRRDAPILIRADEEDMPVTYEIEYDGMRITTWTSMGTDLGV